MFWRMALSAVIFDLDGTLLDSNEAHVDAWIDALNQYDYKVARDRIAVEIGKGGDQLVPSILGAEIARHQGKSLAKADVKAYVKIAESKALPMFAGSESLLNELRRLGLKTALATSSAKSQLKVAERSAGVAFSKWFNVIATGDDADHSKPSPQIVGAAIARLKLGPAECVMIGDTPYDAMAARDAGVVFLGLTCGRMSDNAQLRRSGARAVFGDPSDLLANLTSALKIASPGAIKLTDEIIDGLMQEALDVARVGLARGEAPIGCVLADGSGNVIARGHNALNARQDKIAHAEMVAFQAAVGKIAVDARDVILVSTLEPCVMCLGASMEAAVDTIIYGLRAPADGGVARVNPPTSPESVMPRLIGGVRANESRALMEEFLKRCSGSPAQRQFAEQLLKMTAS